MKALLLLAALHTPPDRSRYVMEPDEIMTRAALCMPSRAIPMPCPRRLKRRR